MSGFARRAMGVVMLLLVTQGAAAQGTLSTQGFGYPLGGLSARAAAVGGALAEFDARSSRNPAAVTSQRPGLYLQYDPEFREVKSGANRDRTVTPRFSGFGISFKLGEQGALGLSTHSFLDRTFTTSVRSGQRLGPDSVSFTETFGSSGAINDSRVSIAWNLGSRVSVGGAFHAYTGENRLNLRREFDDSLRYGTLIRDLTLAYSGHALSAGVIVRPVRWLSAAASIRRGGSLKLRVVDTLRSSADVPDRIGFAAKLDAIPGVSLIASADRTSWSSLNGLGSTLANAQDGWEYSVGADLSGQRTRTTPWVYSVGYRTRDLPFAAAGSLVTEKSITGGVSVPIAGPRASVDVAVQRALRDAKLNVTERAWLLSVGFTVRP